MSRSVGRRRFGLVLTLSTLAALCAFGAARGQGPGGVVWRCGKCGAELGRGGPMPRLAACPVCGARFDNGFGPRGAGPAGPGPGFAGPPALFVVAGVFGVLVLVGGGLLLFFLLRPRPRRPYRGPDYDEPYARY